MTLKSAQIAENFIKLGRVSGTAMADINGALIQFTQGLASGRLQGDELRSIFERLPQVIQLIAKEMGIATGAGSPNGCRRQRSLLTSWLMPYLVQQRKSTHAFGDFRSLPQSKPLIR